MWATGDNNGLLDCSIVKEDITSLTHAYRSKETGKKPDDTGKNKAKKVQTPEDYGKMPIHGRKKGNGN
jgi:hypothetical protein